MRLRTLFNQVAAEVAAARGEKAKPLRPDDFERVLRQTLREEAVTWWGRPDLRPYITTNDPVDVTFVDGVADMTDPVYNTFLFESLTVPPLATIFHPEYEEPFSFTRNYGMLFDGGVVGGMVRYAMQGREIHTAGSSNGRAEVNGVAQIFGSGFVPTVTAAGDGTLHDGVLPALQKALVARFSIRPAKGGGGQ